MLRPAWLWMFLFFAACTDSRPKPKTIALPFEELLLLLPRTEITREYALGGADMQRVDVGIDFDGTPNRVTLQVRDRAGSILPAVRISGSSMRRAVCGVETDGRVFVSLFNHQFSSLRAAIRVAPAGSSMCTPPAAIPDEYWARLDTGKNRMPPWGRTSGRTAETP